MVLEAAEPFLERLEMTNPEMLAQPCLKKFKCLLLPWTAPNPIAKQLFQCDRESIKILTSAPNCLLAKKGRLFSKAAEEYLSRMLGRLSPLEQMKLLTNPSGVDASLLLSAFDILDEEDFNNYVNRLLPQLRWYKSKYQDETLGGMDDVTRQKILRIAAKMQRADVNEIN